MMLEISIKKETFTEDDFSKEFIRISVTKPLSKNEYPKIKEGKIFDDPSRAKAYLAECIDTYLIVKNKEDQK